MKRTCLGLFVVVFSLFIFTGLAWGYNPATFEDTETISVQGQRPKVDIEVSELTVNIQAEDFVDGIATKTVTISNAGTVPCHLALTVKDVPVDLNVKAEVDNDFLQRNDLTTLTVTVELSDQQKEEDFVFVVVVEATLLP